LRFLVVFFHVNAGLVPQTKPWSLKFIVLLHFFPL
jgi:hypothetical protein